MAKLLGKVSCKHLILAFAPKYKKHAEKFRKHLDDICRKSDCHRYVNVYWSCTNAKNTLHRVAKQPFTKNARCILISDDYRDLVYQDLLVYLYDDGHIEVAHSKHISSEFYNPNKTYSRFIISKDRYRGYIYINKNNEGDRALFKGYDEFRIRVLKNAVAKARREKSKQN